MYRIVKKEALKPTVILYEIEAPMVAKKAEPASSSSCVWMRTASVSPSLSMIMTARRAP